MFYLQYVLLLYFCFMLPHLPYLSHDVPPVTADLYLHLTSFFFFLKNQLFLCPHLTSNTTLCAFALFSSPVLYRCGSIWAYNSWGHLTGTHGDFSVWLLPGQQADCVHIECVCVCVLMCSVTLPLCLPATFCLNSAIPGGIATQTETDTHISSISQ